LGGGGKKEEDFLLRIGKKRKGKNGCRMMFLYPQEHKRGTAGEGKSFVAAGRTREKEEAPFPRGKERKSRPGGDSASSKRKARRCSALI